jgi:hypothetical protein
MRYAAFLLAFAVGLAAQEPPPPTFAEAQNPAPIDAFELDGGYRFAFREGMEDETYYRVAYRGKMLTTAGTPVKEAQSLDLGAPAVGTAAGDVRDLELRLEEGAASLGGTLLDAFGARPLPLRALERLQLRGTAFVGGRTSGGPLQFAAGLESPPLRLPGASRAGISNWLVIGFNGQHQEDPDSPADDDFALATYRAFLGKAFGWRKSADVGKTAEAIERLFLAAAPTFSKAQEVRTAIRAVAANNRTALQQLFIDAVDEASGDSDWPARVREIARGHADAVTDQPTLSVYLESSGWYDLRGEGLRSLTTLTADYWFMPERDDVFLRLRYENGHERADPAERKHHLMLSAAMRF